MKRTISRLIVAAFLGFALPVHSEELPPPDDNDAENYVQAVFKLFSIVRIVKFERDLCNESFPALQKTNDDAYLAWQSRNSNIIDEINKNLKIIAWREAKKNIGIFWFKLDQTGLLGDQAQELYGKQLKAGSFGPYDAQCKNYTVFVEKSRIGNIEKSLRRDLLWIRNEPITQEDLNYPKVN